MALGLGVIFGGYWLTYFGWCSLRGPGVGLLDLAVPGRTVVIPDATGSSSSAPLGFPGKGATPGPAAGGSKTINPQPPGAITDPYRSFPGGVGGLGSFG